MGFVKMHRVKEWKVEQRQWGCNSWNTSALYYFHTYPLTPRGHLAYKLVSTNLGLKNGGFHFKQIAKVLMRGCWWHWGARPCRDPHNPPRSCRWPCLTLAAGMAGEQETKYKLQMKNGPWISEKNFPESYKNLSPVPDSSQRGKLNIQELTVGVTKRGNATCHSVNTVKFEPPSFPTL